jgi:dTDP-glucose 4,6-dehydratase
MISTIVDGTTRTLDIARRGNARRLLFLSSGVVHGATPPGSSTHPEDARTAPDPLDPGTTYAQAKRLAEHLCALAAADGSLVLPIARCWAFVGPGLPLDGHFAVGNFLRDALSGGPIRVAGDGTPLRSYLYGSDLAAWLLTLLLRGQTRAYDVGGDRVVSIRELASSVAALAGCSVEIARPATPGAPADRYVPSIGRMESEFGLRPTVGLEEGLRRTLAWHGFPPVAGGSP